MACATCRASRLIQLMIFHLRLNMLQKAGNWMRTHAQRKTKVKKLKKKSLENDDDFFDIGTEAVGEQPSGSDLYDKSKKYNTSYQTGGPFGKSFCGKKNKLKFKRNTVTPSEGHAWNEHSETKGKKRHSRTFRLFGSRSTKVSNIKSDFADKPYHRNANAGKL